jgi:N-acetyl-anhydromuramyl-L-alanine amidase AmpD
LRWVFLILFLNKTEITDIKTIQIMLVEYGYKLEITGIVDQATLNVMRAFNEHFNQHCLDPWNEHSQAALNQLIYLLRE